MTLNVSRVPRRTFLCLGAIVHEIEIPTTLPANAGITRAPSGSSLSWTIGQNNGLFRKVLRKKRYKKKVPGNRDRFIHLSKLPGIFVGFLK